MLRHIPSLSLPPWEHLITHRSYTRRLYDAFYSDQKNRTICSPFPFPRDLINGTIDRSSYKPIASNLFPVLFFLEDIADAFAQL